MKKQGRRKFALEFKAKLALEASKNELTLTELGSKHQLSLVILSNWKVSTQLSTCFPIIFWPLALHKNNSYGQKRGDGPPDGGICGQRAEPKRIQRIQGHCLAHLQLLVPETQERE